MSYESLTNKLLKGSKQTLFYVTVVPINSQGQVLIAERKSDGIWTTPGGGAEPGETPEQAAIREAFEEAGLAIIPPMLEPMGVKAAPNGKPVHCFLVRTDQNKFSVKLDPDKEVGEWKWYSREELPHGLSRQKNANRLETIGQAMMKFHGLRKNMEDDKVLSLVDKLNKAGQFQESKHPRAQDGKFGHGAGTPHKVSAKQPSAAHAPVDAAPASPVSKLKAHLDALEGGGVVPGVKTQSDKPVVTNMDQAKALGYDVQDHIDAMNAHYELAQKTQAQLEKLKMAGHKIPAEGAKIARFHQKKMKEHMLARQYLEERKKNTAAAIKEKKAEAVSSVKKSTTQMGSGVGDRDINTGDFAQANNAAHAAWLERLYSGMEGFQFADEPRAFQCDAGSILLSKVDDGIYSGAFTKQDPSGLEDHARVRIERMTIPELVQFMVAQEWIKNPVLEQPVDTIQEVGQTYASQMDHVAGEIEKQEKEAELRALNEALKNPSEVPPGGYMDQKIKLLELVAKLLG